VPAVEDDPGSAVSEQIRWMSTKEAAEHLGVTLRSLYRFIDEGMVTAYKFGRVIRLQEGDVNRFIESCRIEPGSLEHLYPELKGSRAGAHAGGGAQ
jgi:excisionase family DNA binding protein